MNSFVFDGNPKDTEKIINLNNKGEKVLCYKRHAELLIIASMEAEEKYGKPSGVYCPTDETHIQVWFTLAERRKEFWRRVERRMQEAKEKEKLDSQSPSTDNEKNK
jgi:hypothetical protein